MTYTRAADIYLGDVSSQVYEFLHRPRSCIFLNSKAVPWRGNPDYAHWRLGQVVSSASGLSRGLEFALAAQGRRKRAQQRAFASTFGDDLSNGGARAARAILEDVINWSGCSKEGRPHLSSNGDSEDGRMIHVSQRTTASVF